jgi:hypothetical protein
LNPGSVRCEQNVWGVSAPHMLAFGAISLCKEFSTGTVSPPSNTSKVPSYGPFRDLKANLQKLAVDLRSTPVGILFRYTSNQGSDFGGDPRPTTEACPRAPSPVEPEPGSVPANHGVRLYNGQCLGPPRPDAAQNGPEQPVGGVQVRARMFSLEYSELLTQGEDLKCAVAAIAEENSQCG